MLKIKSDCEDQYTNIQFKNYLESVRVHQELTTLYSLKYNGIVDRYNKVVVESVCYMIHAKNVSLKLLGASHSKK